MELNEDKEKTHWLMATPKFANNVRTRTELIEITHELTSARQQFV